MIFRNLLIPPMALSATSCSTYPVLSTPPHPLLESLPTDLSPFAEANQKIDELIQAMKNRTNVLNTSAPVDPLTTKKSPTLTFPTFRGNPLAMALYQPKRQRVARVPVKSSQKSQNLESSLRCLQRGDRKSTRLNSSHSDRSRMPSSA